MITKMNKSLTNIWLLLAILSTTCQKLDPVKVTKFSNQEPPTAITDNSATIKGRFVDVADDVTSYGHCWGIEPNPTIEKNKTVNNGRPAKQQDFMSNLTGLAPNTTYYVRLYATNSGGTNYGNQVTFTSLIKKTISITSPTAVDEWQTETQYTISWTDNISENVRIELLKGGIFSTNITGNTPSNGSYNYSPPAGLTPGPDYSIRIVSVDNASVADTSDLFTIIEKMWIQIEQPNVSTEWTKGSTNDIIWASNLQGNVKIELYKGADFINILIASTPNDGSQAWTVPGTLEPAANYHIKITSLEKISVSNTSGPFFIQMKPPVLITGSATSISHNIATLNGSVDPSFENLEMSFEWGITAAYGNTVNATPFEVSGSSPIAVNAQLTGLTNGTTYNYRLRAKYGFQYFYGSNQTFTTDPGSITDIDGNVYNTVRIGNQFWLKENLKTIRYNDGTNIPLVTDNAAWSVLNSPAYCWYNNDIGNKNTYGALYNWYAVNTSKLCPTGWHVPSDAEWTQLTNYLGGEGVAGGKIKETGTTHWESPNTGATNESGFTALPAGIRGLDGTFHSIWRYSDWWSATVMASNAAFCRQISFSSYEVSSSGANKEAGFSVRCLKD
jgi:uncharacterized protein (TIGR02145 family)